MELLGYVVAFGEAEREAERGFYSACGEGTASGVLADGVCLGLFA